jgi:hypothetical protein
LLHSKLNTLSSSTICYSLQYSFHKEESHPFFHTFDRSKYCFIFPILPQPPSGPRPPHYGGFIITQRRATVGRTPLDEGSARRRDLYLTTHNTHNRQTSMPPVGFERTVPVFEGPQTHALDLAATATGKILFGNCFIVQLTYSPDDRPVRSGTNRTLVLL